MGPLSHSLGNFAQVAVGGAQLAGASVASAALATWLLPAVARAKLPQEFVIPVGFSLARKLLAHMLFLSEPAR